MQVERLDQKRTVARIDKLQCLGTGIATDEQCLVPKVRLLRCRQLEQNIAAQIGNQKIQNHAVEMLRSEQGERVLSRFSGDAVEARTFEGDL